MAKWLVSEIPTDDPKRGAIKVEKPEMNLGPFEYKTLYEDKNIIFKTFYTLPSLKMAGYLLDYRVSNAISPKSYFLLENSFGVIYSKKFDETPDLNVIYDDQVVRLVCYSHKSGECDYVLVGRWRV